ncbi:MAG: hypothetical protein Q9187_009642 [Circinaria calcarea]
MGFEHLWRSIKQPLKPLYKNRPKRSCTEISGHAFMPLQYAVVVSNQAQDGGQCIFSGDERKSIIEMSREVVDLKMASVGLEGLGRRWAIHGNTPLSLGGRVPGHNEPGLPSADAQRKLRSERRWLWVQIPLGVGRVVRYLVGSVPEEMLSLKYNVTLSTLPRGRGRGRGVRTAAEMGKGSVGKNAVLRAKLAKNGILRDKAETETSELFRTAGFKRISQLMSERGSFRGRGGAAGGRAGGDHRGGRGGGRGGAQAGQAEKPKKENILDLTKYMDKEINVKFNGGREGEPARSFNALGG